MCDSSISFFSLKLRLLLMFSLTLLVLVHQLFRLNETLSCATFQASTESLNSTLTQFLPSEEQRPRFRPPIGNKCRKEPEITAKTLGEDPNLKYLGFFLEKNSMFYCAVPKVATRSLLKYVTYLHIKYELLGSIRNASSLILDAASKLKNLSLSGSKNLSASKRILSSFQVNKVDRRKKNFVCSFASTRSDFCLINTRGVN